MDEKRKLKVLEKAKTDVSVDETIEEKVGCEALAKNSHPNQTNPIYKNLAKFNNAKIGEKLSVKDLLR